jgi:hypothetical protein
MYEGIITRYYQMATRMKLKCMQDKTYMKQNKSKQNKYLIYTKTITASVVYWLACSPRVPWSGQTKDRKMVFVARIIKEKEQRLVDSELGYFVKVKQHVYPRIVVSVS